MKLVLAECHLKTILCVVVADIRWIPGQPKYHVRLACLDQIPQSVPLFSQCKFGFKRILFSLNK